MHTNCNYTNISNIKIEYKFLNIHNLSDFSLSCVCFFAFCTVPYKELETWKN